MKLLNILRKNEVKMFSPKHINLKIDNKDLILYHLTNRKFLEEVFENKGRFEYAHRHIYLTPDKAETRKSFSTTLVYDGCTELCLLEVPFSKIADLPSKDIITKAEFPYLEVAYVPYLEGDMIDISRDNFRENKFNEQLDKIIRNQV